MNADELARAQWKKSSYSGNTGNCVEVATNLDGIVAVRDSKDPEGARVTVSPQAWRAFMQEMARRESQP
jgi:hypothetical protein